MHFCANAASPDRQHLVDEHDVGVGLDHHGEGEPDHHPRRVVLELEVDELSSSANSSTASSRRRASRRLRPIITPLSTTFSRDVSSGLKPDAELDERRQAARHPDPAGVGRVDARQDLQQRALAGAVAADDAEELALVDVEGDVAQRAQLAVLVGANGWSDALLERVDPVVGDAEGLLDPPGLDHHGAALHGARADAPSETEPA